MKALLLVPSNNQYKSKTFLTMNTNKKINNNKINKWNSLLVRDSDLKLRNLDPLWDYSKERDNKLLLN